MTQKTTPVENGVIYMHVNCNGDQLYVGGLWQTLELFLAIVNTKIY